MICILAHGGASSGDGPEGGAGSGVLRPRLVTAGSGGPGHRPSSLKYLSFLAFSRGEPRRRPGTATSYFSIEAAPDSRVNPAYLRGARGVGGGAAQQCGAARAFAGA